MYIFQEVPANVDSKLCFTAQLTQSTTSCHLQLVQMDTHGFRKLKRHSCNQQLTQTIGGKSSREIASLLFVFLVKDGETTAHI